ncbi:dihydrodipicolinate synthase family protein [Pararhizobium sp. IMCC21322]|uniref:dihydrodipicolinate synthase family protein n=1 Tax=Pararhizobium sp. IMCC21322 TaxID=3067903 RepID=UPI0027423E9F|nr:dihydrodipicolinate synthase family protein [Pararhizobium sp. IMCC21322]
MILPGFSQALTGISGILVCPFSSDDSLDCGKLKPLVDRAIGAGVHVLVANGNTGEYYGLTADEAEQFVRSAAQHIAGQVPLLAGIGRSIKEACQLAKISAEAGADGLMIHQPPDSFVAPRGIIDYVQRVHAASDGLPIMLYLRNDAIGTDAIVKLCSLEGVAGIKWATPNPLKLAEAIAACPDHLIWVGGLAEVWAPSFYAVGARGFTSGLINVWPERSVSIHTALEAGDYAQARFLIDGMRDFEDVRAEEMNGTNVTAVKAALIMMENDCGPTRPPSAWPLTSTQAQKLKTFLGREGLLPPRR